MNLGRFIIMNILVKYIKVSPNTKKYLINLVNPKTAFCYDFP